jgi:acyl-coenzyme A thioesterase PaaI-like protein
VCGKENKDGLKLDFEIKGRKSHAEFVPDERFQGFEGIVHGGIVSTVLDEAMGKLAFMIGLNAVTSSIKVDLKQPTMVGKKYVVSGEIVEELEKIVKAKAILTDEDNNLVAQAEAVLVKIRK